MKIGDHVKMGQQLGAFVALAENTNLAFNAYVRRFTITCNSNFRGSNALFWCPKTQNHTHTDT